MEVETRAGTFNVHVLSEQLDPAAQVTVIIVNSLTSRMTLNALASFRKFNDVPTNYLIVDNFSSDDVLSDLVREAGEHATILSNRGEPKSIKLGHWDSLLNAIGVDIGSKFVRTPLGFVCHNDVLACGHGWLRHLTEKLTDECRGAAFSHDIIRIGAMHVSGYLYDCKLYTGQDAFWYPVKDVWDVGDHYTHFLRSRNLKYHVCRCTHNDAQLDPDPILDPTVQYGLPIFSVRSVDEQGRVLYMHMGRGSLKSIGAYDKPGKTTHDEWIAFGSWVISAWPG